MYQRLDVPFVYLISLGLWYTFFHTKVNITEVVMGLREDARGYAGTLCTRRHSGQSWLCLTPSGEKKKAPDTNLKNGCQQHGWESWRNSHTSAVGGIDDDVTWQSPTWLTSSFKGWIGHLIVNKFREYFRQLNLLLCPSLCMLKWNLF